MASSTRGTIAGEGVFTLFLRSARVAVAAAIAGALAAGCGGEKPAADATKVPTLNVLVVPGPEMNERRPCYVVVRSVDESSFLEESYSAVAALVFAHDPSVLKAEVIFPDKPKVLQITPPSSGSLAIYVLFTRPQGEWKQMLRGPWSQRLWVQLDGSTVPAPLRR